jgi:hypothetical protein
MTQDRHQFGRERRRIDINDAQILINEFSLIDRLSFHDR